MVEPLPQFSVPAPVRRRPPRQELAWAEGLPHTDWIRTHLWNKNIEFDNFTDEEIAEAMTTTSNGRYAFTKAQIAECRSKFGHGPDPLSALYQQTFDYGLPKREMLKHLFDVAIASPQMSVGGSNVVRPIIDVIIRIKRLAFMNHQPSDLEAWKETQDSDWLGNPIKM